MQALGMIGGQLTIELLANSEEKPQPHGLERCEFLVSANPGQPLHPLNKVASGGELSRISLAIQVIIAEKVATPTLIFDEVDVGIGGKTAAPKLEPTAEPDHALQKHCCHLMIGQSGDWHASIRRRGRCRDAGQTV